MDENKKILASRISVKRVQLNMKQTDVVKKINEYITQHPDEFPDGKLLSYTNISHWEAGFRNIPTIYSNALSYALDCSIAYLYGEDTIEQNKGEAIPHKRAYLYDKQPVFVVFKDKAYADQWGILDYKRDEIILATRKFIRLSATRGTQYNDIIQKILPLAPYDMNMGENSREWLINLPQALMEDHVIIKMRSTDPYVTSLYDGIYKHNENRTAFINNNGLVLPYEGINLSYNVYNAGYMNNAKRVRFNKEYRGKNNAELDKEELNISEESGAEEDVRDVKTEEENIDNNVAETASEIENLDSFVSPEVEGSYEVNIQAEYLPQDMKDPIYIGRPTHIRNGISGISGSQSQAEYYLKKEEPAKEEQANQINQVSQAIYQNAVEQPKPRRGRPRKIKDDNKQADFMPQPQVITAEPVQQVVKTQEEQQVQPVQTIPQIQQMTPQQQAMLFAAYQQMLNQQAVPSPTEPQKRRRGRPRKDEKQNV